MDDGVAQRTGRGGGGCGELAPPGVLRSLLASDPDAALIKARSALRHADDYVQALYIEAAAYARLGDYKRSRAALLRATRLEPSNAVPWALIGDLATRRGDDRLARRAYKRAYRLNPRDATLAGLAASPAD